MCILLGFLSFHLYIQIPEILYYLYKKCFALYWFSGHETKAMLNNNGPRYKRSKLERQMNVDVFWCVIILLVMCLFSAIGM